MNTLTETQVRLFASPKSWIEGEAVRQLYATAKLDGVRLAVGFPDLHPGKGTPVGAVYVTEAFAPDFYLPDQDLYVEVTVMKQSLVTRKNRKLRKLRERYPEIRIKLFYKRDIERLAERYNLDLAS